MRTAMMAITTNSSISVNAECLDAFTGFLRSWDPGSGPRRFTAGSAQKGVVATVGTTHPQSSGQEPAVSDHLRREKCQGACCSLSRMDRLIAQHDVVNRFTAKLSRRTEVLSRRTEAQAGTHWNFVTYGVATAANGPEPR